MRIVVIGATGHVGGYLVPRLVRAGHEVVAVSRGQREPYRADEAWASVQRIDLDREAEDAAASGGDQLGGGREQPQAQAQAQGPTHVRPR